ncbi:MAG: SH3 domain-containing protein [Chloroflexota bacterium]
MKNHEEDFLPGGFSPQDEPAFPTEPIRLPPARRRRARRRLVAPGDDDRGLLLTHLAQRAFPSIEFFLFSLLCGAILGAGFLLDSQSLLLLGILLAPLMTPWVGLSLASATGGWRFFFTTLAGLLISSGLIFITGLLAGLAARLWLPLPLLQAHIHSHLWWPNLLVLSLGSILLVVSFVRSEEKPLLPSVMLTYELYLPLSAGAFGLGVGAERIWPDGALVFLVHISLAILLGVITLAFLRFRPANIFGYLLPIVMLVLSLAAVLLFTGLGTYFIPGLVQASATPTITSSPLPTSTTRTTTDVPAATTNPSPTGPTRTPTMEIPATITPSKTSTPQATPVYARINSTVGGGALVRSEPGGGYIIRSLLNDTLIQVLPDVEQVSGAIWVLIRTTDGVEGWVLQSVLVTATPAPNW